MTWLQFKGDPAIRQGLFSQCRIESDMDRNIDRVLDAVDQLMRGHGIFHAKLHFSSSRATLWSATDPMRYRVHVLGEILSPEIRRAYPIPPICDFSVGCSLGAYPENWRRQPNQASEDPE